MSLLSFSEAGSISSVLSVASHAAEYALGAATLPGVLELGFLTLGGFRPVPETLSPCDRRIRLAVIVPAHNEEKLIGACVESLLKSAAAAGCEHEVRIIVIADNCDDETACIAARAGAQVLERQDTNLRGKGYALELAFTHALHNEFDAVFVVDADSIVTANTIGVVANALAAGANAVQIRYEVRNAGDSYRTRLMRLALLGFNVVRPRGRGFWTLSAGIFGSGFGLSKETMLNVRYAAHSVVEDLEFHLQLVRSRKKVQFLDSATVYGEMPAAGTGVVTQRSRWEGGRLLLARTASVPLLRDILRGRWRLVEPLLDLLSLPLAYQVLLLSMLLAFGSVGFKAYALAGLVVTMCHVLAAAAAGGAFLSNLRALLTVPFYLGWKITMLPAVVYASRRNTNWIRTDRSRTGGNIV